MDKRGNIATCMIHVSGQYQPDAAPALVFNVDNINHANSIVVILLVLLRSFFTQIICNSSHILKWIIIYPFNATA